MIQETTLEKINKYAMSVGIMVLFGTCSSISAYVSYYYAVEFILLAIPFLFASLFCAFMSYYWLDKIKEDL